jgi:hypothetical protein
LAQAARRTRTESLRTNSTKKKERNQEQGIGRSENKQSKRPNRAEQDKHLIILIDGKPTEHQLTKKLKSLDRFSSITSQEEQTAPNSILDWIRFDSIHPGRSGAEGKQASRGQDKREGGGGTHRT